MMIEMMTKNPQRSDWSFEEDTIENKTISNNILTDVNNDDSRSYEKTK
jgi:hypothetical protein